MSTRKNVRPSCSPKCRREQARRHCQACVCVLCPFCSSVGGELDGGAGATSASEPGAGTNPLRGAPSEARSRTATGLYVARVESRRGARRSSAFHRPAQRHEIGTRMGAPAADERGSNWALRRRRREPSTTERRPEGKAVERDDAQEWQQPSRWLGWHRRWTPTSDAASAEPPRNQSITSIVLRALGYIPGPQLPMEFGGPQEDFTVLGAPSALVARLLPAETDAAGPAPLSLRAQRILARKAARSASKTGKKLPVPDVDWHASPVAGLLPQSNARPKTPKARVKKRLKKQRESHGPRANSTSSGREQRSDLMRPSPKRRGHAVGGPPKKGGHKAWHRGGAANETGRTHPEHHPKRSPTGRVVRKRKAKPAHLFAVQLPPDAANTTEPERLPAHRRRARRGAPTGKPGQHKKQTRRHSRDKGAQQAASGEASDEGESSNEEPRYKARPRDGAKASRRARNGASGGGKEDTSQRAQSQGRGKRNRRQSTPSAPGGAVEAADEHERVKEMPHTAKRKRKHVKHLKKKSHTKASRPRGRQQTQQDAR